MNKQKIEKRASQMAKDIIAEVLGDDGWESKQLDFKRQLDKLKAETTDMRKKLNIILVRAGLHPNVHVAASYGRRIDPIKALNSGQMLGRMHNPERKP